MPATPIPIFIRYAYADGAFVDRLEAETRALRVSATPSSCFQRKAQTEHIVIVLCSNDYSHHTKWRYNRQPCGPGL
jgi:hypothetical protein